MFLRSTKYHPHKVMHTLTQELGECHLPYLHMDTLRHTDTHLGQGCIRWTKQWDICHRLCLTIIIRHKLTEEDTLLRVSLHMAS